MTSKAVEAGPALPRRAFVAAALSAVVAGGAVALGIIGQTTIAKTESFRFSRGTSLADGEEERLRGVLAAALPDDRKHVVIVGHTGTSGDAGANLDLSVKRAEVAAQMARAMGLPDDRLTVTGIGGSTPLSQEDGESDRAHQSRMARVDVTVQVRR